MKNAAYLMTIPAVFGTDVMLKKKSEEKKLPIEKEGNDPIIWRNYHNTGAMLNFGAGKSFVKVLSFVFTAAVTVYFIITLGHKGKNLLKAGLALVLGGAYSNMYDRMRKDYVVDYISFRCRWKRFSNIVFNIGDFAIMAGALLAVIATDRSE